MQFDAFYLIYDTTWGVTACGSCGCIPVPSTTFVLAIAVLPTFAVRSGTQPLSDMHVNNINMGVLNIFTFDFFF